MEEYAVVKSLWDYLEQIDQMNKCITDNHGRKPQIWFRGHACTEESNSNWKLIPSLQRVNTGCCEDDYFKIERSMNNEFQCRASVFLETKPEMDDYASWLTLMQHYGFPTRLLDWSRSPLYALYFATSNRNHVKNNGCIWILKPGLLNSYAHLQANTYIYHMAHKQVSEVIYSSFKGYDKSDKKKLKLYSKYENKIIAAYPTQKDQRVFNQQSVFTIHNSLSTLEEIHNEILLKCQEKLLLKVLIPAEFKEKIFDQLFSSGVTHSNVFPDVEHLALDIKKLYGIQ